MTMCSVVPLYRAALFVSLIVTSAPALAQSDARTIEREEVSTVLSKAHADLMSFGMASEEVKLILEQSQVEDVRAQHGIKLDILENFMEKATEAHGSLESSKRVLDRFDKRLNVTFQEIEARCSNNKQKLGANSQKVADDICAKQKAMVERQRQLLTDQLQAHKEKAAIVKKSLTEAHELFGVIQAGYVTSLELAKFDALLDHTASKIDATEVDTSDELARALAPEIFQNPIPTAQTP